MELLNPKDHGNNRKEFPWVFSTLFA